MGACSGQNRERKGVREGLHEGDHGPQGKKARRSAPTHEGMSKSQKAQEGAQETAAARASWRRKKESDGST